MVVEEWEVVKREWAQKRPVRVHEGVASARAEKSMTSLLKSPSPRISKNEDLKT